MILKGLKIALLFFIILATVSLVYFNSQENHELPSEFTASEAYINIVQDEIKSWDRDALIIAVQGIDYRYPVRIPQETVNDEFITCSKVPAKTILDYRAPSWIFVLYSKQKKELMWIEATLLEDANGKKEWKTVKIVQPTPLDYSKFAITPEMLERNAHWKIFESHNGVSYLLSNLNPPDITTNTTAKAKEIRVLHSQFLVINVPVHDKYLSSNFKFKPITGVVVLPDEKSYGVVVQVVPHNETHDRILAEYWQTEVEGTIPKTEGELTPLTITSLLPSDAHQAEIIIKEGYIVAHYWADIIREGFCERSETENYKCRDINYDWAGN